jgi:hypothetical protein
VTGATAIATSDSILINGDGRRKARPPKTTAARSMVTSYPRCGLYAQRNRAG